MKIQINFKKVKISETLVEYTKEKLERELEKFHPYIETADIIISESGYDYSASCHMKGKSNLSFVAEGVGKETHSAVDNMIKKIDTILRKQKEKATKHREHHGGDKGYDDQPFEEGNMHPLLEEEKKKSS